MTANCPFMSFVGQASALSGDGVSHSPDLSVRYSSVGCCEYIDGVTPTVTIEHTTKLVIVHWAHDKHLHVTASLCGIKQGREQPIRVLANKSVDDAGRPARLVDSGRRKRPRPDDVAAITVLEDQRAGIIWVNVKCAGRRVVEHWRTSSDDPRADRVSPSRQPHQPVLAYTRPACVLEGSGLGSISVRDAGHGRALDDGARQRRTHVGPAAVGDTRIIDDPSARPTEGRREPDQGRARDNDTGYRVSRGDKVAEPHLMAFIRAIGHRPELRLPRGELTSLCRGQTSDRGEVALACRPHRQCHDRAVLHRRALRSGVRCPIAAAFGYLEYPSLPAKAPGVQ